MGKGVHSWENLLSNGRLRLLWIWEVKMHYGAIVVMQGMNCSVDMGLILLWTEYGTK